MCEESWTSAVLNCSASSQCTRWNFRYPNFCCFLFIPFYSSIQHPRTHTPVMALSHGCQDLQTFSPELELLLSLKMILLLRVYKGLNWSMQGSIKKKGFCFVFFWKKKCKSNHYLSVPLLSSVVSFGCGRTKALWSSSVSEMFSNFSLLYQWGPL